MPLPVITVAQMREWETASWNAGRNQADVIQQVGKAVALRAMERTRQDDIVLILAGKGHNGDDARAMQHHLTGRHIRLLNVESPQLELHKLDSILAQRPSLIIDGLFGIGLNRPLDEAWKDYISRVNASRRAVLAIDVPSGLNADTGETFGAAIEASETLTVGAPKHGLLKQAAWPFVGRLEVTADIGLTPCPHTGDLQWSVAGDFEDFPPRRTVFGHKGTFGHLGIIAGSMGFHGAAVLAARGAQRSQPGLVTLITQEAAYHPTAAQLQSAMVQPWSADLKTGDEFSAWLIGPGLAARDLPDEVKVMTRRIWRDLKAAVVVDASAIGWLATGSTQKGAVRVMTPHPGEAAGLLKSTVQRVQSDRVASLRQLSKLHGDCWVVLKGHQTLIGRSTGDVFVNSTGNPHLAQGGSGDVLAGLIAGRLAQPEVQTAAGPAICHSVWLHGAAADRLESRGCNWTVEDLLVEIGSGL